MKKIIYIFWWQFLNSLANKRVWAGYLVGMLVTLRITYEYSGYAGSRVFQVFEPIILGMMNVGNITLMLIGFIIIISDAPFVNHCSMLSLYRSSRGQWFWGMFIYIGAHAFLYNILSFIVSMIYILRQAYPDNIWSRPLRNHVLFPSEEAIVKWNITTEANRSLITDYSPRTAFIHTILLIMMYSIFISLILLVFNVVFNKAVGAIIAGSIHVIGYIFMYDGFGMWSLKMSLFYHSLFMQHLKGYITLGSSYLMLLFVIIGISFAVPMLIKHADFRLSAGEENE